MQKTSFAIIVAFLALYLQSHATVWIGYFALQEEIAKHCENKSNAACSGKCQVQKLERQMSSETLVQVNIPEVSEFLTKIISPIPFIQTQVLSFRTFSDSLFPHGHKSEIFRPPIFA